MKPITAIVLGAGHRGSTYAGYAKDHPDELQIVAIADPRQDRRDPLADKLNVPAEGRFDRWEDVLALPKMADAVFVCTQDDFHTAPAIRALELGYHVLLEKPMSNNEEECRAIEAAARKAQRTLAVCHVLRYTPFYMTLKSLIDKGEIGEVTTINQIENVGFWPTVLSAATGAPERRAAP